MLDDLVNMSYIQSYVESMETAEEIATKNLPFQIDDNEENDEHVFHEMTFWKNILQHKLNLRKNYKYYSDCDMILTDEKSSNGNEMSNDYHVDNELVGIKELTTVAVKYAYYFAILQTRSNDSSEMDCETEILNKPSNNKMVCIYCGSEISPSENKCAVCEGEEFEYQDISVVQSSINEEDLENTKIENHSPTVRDQNSVLEEIMVTETKIDIKPPKEKWECTKCGYYNDLNVVHCEACLTESGDNGKWQCEKCSYINSRSDHHCHACEVVCWFNGCRRNICIATQFCGHCGLDQDAVPRYGCEIMRKTRRSKINRVLICSYCSQLNNANVKNCGKCKNETKDHRYYPCKNCGWANSEKRTVCVKCKMKIIR